MWLISEKGLYNGDWVMSVCILFAAFNNILKTVRCLQEGKIILHIERKGNLRFHILGAIPGMEEPTAA